MQATTYKNTHTARGHRVARTQPAVVRSLPTRRRETATEPAPKDDAAAWARRAMHANGFGDAGM